MRVQRYISWAVRCFSIVVLLCLAGYAAYISVMWYRYGKSPHTVSAENQDPLLDSFMPVYDVAGRQHVHVAAPAATTFSAACDTKIEQLGIVRAIFRTRALVLGGESEKPLALGIVDRAKSWGWGLLAENPGRELVFGAVTQPWAATPVFRSLPPAQFAEFNEPGYVKIVWMLRVDPVTSTTSLASTETRVATTDPVSRARFRRYWSWSSPGSMLIRFVVLRAARQTAEQQMQPTSRTDTSRTMAILTIIAAIVLAVHGFIHLIGTAVYAEHIHIRGLSYKTTLLSGRWDLGTGGVRMYGWLWVFPAVAFVVAAIALLAGWSWWNPVLLAATLVSLGLIVLDWGNAFRGAIVDVAILLVILAGSRIAACFSWFAS